MPITRVDGCDIRDDSVGTGDSQDAVVPTLN